MPKNLSLAELPPDVFSACVVAAAVDTPYLAAGRGHPILLLSTSPRLRASVLREMPRHVRVIAPALSGAEHYCQTVAGFSDWLINFLDALGLHATTVLADATLAERATEFSADCDTRVTRVILLRNAAIAPAHGEVHEDAQAEDKPKDSEPTARLQFVFSDDTHVEHPAALAQMVDNSSQPLTDCAPRSS